MATTESRKDGAAHPTPPDEAEYGIDRRVLLALLAVPVVPIGLCMIGLLATRILGVPPRPLGTPTASSPSEHDTSVAVAVVPKSSATGTEELLASVDPFDGMPEVTIEVTHAVDVPEVVVDEPSVAASSSPGESAADVAAIPPEPVEPDWRVREYELVENLQQRAVEIDFNPHGKPRGKTASTTPSDLRLSSLANRNLLAGLPIRGADECSADEKTARHADEVSKLLGRLRSQSVRQTGLSQSETGDWFFEQAILGELTRREWNEPSRVSTLDQMLQVQSIAIRERLVETLAKTPGREAAVALANRAVFDTSGTVRARATAALRGRKVEHYRDRLLTGLRHPWAPAAVNAARAVVALGNEELHRTVRELLAAPDPADPFDENGQLMTRELVRVNHMRNCVLCHAPSQSRSDLVRGLVPTPGRPLPQAYYQGRSRGAFVRADITYVKQDFSLIHHVEKASPWPDRQRFDYFVRVRELTEKERKARSADTRGPSPQRLAVQLAALGSEGGIQSVIADDELRKLLYEVTHSADPRSVEDEAETVNETES